MSKTTIPPRVIHFEDHGQDFLWWRLDGDRVVESSLQGWLWEGTRVANPEAVQGEILRIKNRATGGWMTLKYPVARVELLDARPEEVASHG